MKLKGKTAIVTGAGRGIGRSIAITLGKAGVNMICAARTLEQISETAEAIKTSGGSARAIAADVSDTSEVEGLVEQTLDSYGAIDILVNNAGMNQSIGALWEVDSEVWWRDLTVNLKGPMLTTHAVLPHMRQRDSGVIINMLGGGAPSPLPGASGYACSKAALARFTDNLAMDLRISGSKVLVYGLNPGLVKTELSVGHADHPRAKYWLPGLKENIEVGNYNAPELSAEAVLDLVSRKPVFMAGRMFSAGMDLEELEARSEEILEKDSYSLRLNQ